MQSRTAWASAVMYFSTVQGKGESKLQKKLATNGNKCERFQEAATYAVKYEKFYVNKLLLLLS